jgi:diadenylate cyclase
MGERLTEALELIAPGTAVREAIDNIVRARTGALLVFADEHEIDPLISGGIPIHIDFAPMKCYELAKMDGAILLDRRGRRIMYANVQLMPDATIPSVETGTRHRTAERVAKQIDALALSVSARRDVVSLYIDGIHYVLEEPRVVVSKANQALQALEKYKSRLNQVLTSLSALEFEDAVTLYDVLSVLQRSEMVLRIAGEIERYNLELGVEGRLIEVQLEELMLDVREDYRAVVGDYLPDTPGLVVDEAAAALNTLHAEDLLSLALIAEIIGYGVDDLDVEQHVSPRGFRMLRKIPRLSGDVIGNVVYSFGSLDEIMNAPTDRLADIDGVGSGRAHDIKEGFLRLRELNLLERYG